MTNDEIVAQVLLDEGFTAGVSDASAAGLAALRARGFAVVRTADVEAARDCARGMALECRGKPRDDYNALADRLEEAIR